MSFYLTLPSDSSVKYYPDNVLSHYVTHLPMHIDLQGDWEVGVVEFVYPHSWNNFPKSIPFEVELEMEGLKMAKVSKGFYKSPADIIKAMGESVNQKDYLTLKYNEHTKRVKVRCRMGAHLSLPTGLAEVLGFNPGIVTPCNICSVYEFVKDANGETHAINKQGGECLKFIPSTNEKFISHVNKEGKEVASINSPYRADVHNDFHLIYMYCDIIEPQVVGGIYAPLLRIVTVKGEDGDLVHELYDRPHYIPLIRKNFQTIEMVIRTHSGKLVPFEGGKLIVKLHFRQKLLR